MGLLERLFGRGDGRLRELLRKLREEYGDDVLLLLLELLLRAEVPAAVSAARSGLTVLGRFDRLDCAEAILRSALARSRDQVP